MLNALMGIHGVAMEAAPMCHRTSNAMSYAVTLTVVIWAIGSVYVWRRFFCKQPTAAQFFQTT